MSLPRKAATCNRDRRPLAAEVYRWRGGNDGERGLFVRLWRGERVVGLTFESKQGQVGRENSWLQERRDNGSNELTRTPEPRSLRSWVCLSLVSSQSFPTRYSADPSAAFPAPAQHRFALLVTLNRPAPRPSLSSSPNPALRISLLLFSSVLFSSHLFTVYLVIALSFSPIARAFSAGRVCPPSLFHS